MHSLKKKNAGTVFQIARKKTLPVEVALSVKRCAISVKPRRRGGREGGEQRRGGSSRHAEAAAAQALFEHALVYRV
jgi:hypothetical protein